MKENRNGRDAAARKGGDLGGIESVSPILSARFASFQRAGATEQQGYPRRACCCSVPGTREKECELLGLQ